MNNYQLEAELAIVRKKMRRLTATNLILAITVLAFGGATAAYALAPANSVNSASIIDRSIGTPDVKVGAFGGQTILDNSMTGTDINESTLVLTCPSGMGRVGDICYTGERTDDWFTANETCAKEGRRLPTISEASVMGNKQNFNSMWTNALHYINSTTLYAIITRGTGGYQSGTVSFSVDYTYRCVATVGSRP